MTSKIFTTDVLIADVLLLVGLADVLLLVGLERSLDRDLLNNEE